MLFDTEATTAVISEIIATMIIKCDDVLVDIFYFWLEKNINTITVYRYVFEYNFGTRILVKIPKCQEFRLQVTTSRSLSRGLNICSSPLFSPGLCTIHLVLFLQLWMLRLRLFKPVLTWLLWSNHKYSSLMLVLNSLKKHWGGIKIQSSSTAEYFLICTWIIFIILCFKDIWKSPQI